MENELLLDNALKRELSVLYEGRDRHYHNLAHIEAMLALAGEYRKLLGDPEAVEAAIWFHDAVYDSRAKDNEAQSAALAEKARGPHRRPAPRPHQRHDPCHRNTPVAGLRRHGRDA